MDSSTTTELSPHHCCLLLLEEEADATDWCLLEGNRSELWPCNQTWTEVYDRHRRELERLQTLCAGLEAYFALTFGFLGLLGAAASVAIMHQRGYCNVDFLLFRVIGYLETVQMVVVCAMNVLNYCQCERWYACSLFWAHAATTIMNICSDAVDLIVVFLCVERATACLSPLHFRLVHSQNAYRLVICAALVFPSFFAACQAAEVRLRYDHDLGRFVDEQSEFAQSRLYDWITSVNTVRLCVTAGALVCAALWSVFGFWSASRRRRRLSSIHRQSYCSPPETTTTATQPDLESPGQQKSFRSGGGGGGGGGNGGEFKRRAKCGQNHLCVLQLCLTTPIVVNQILYVCGYGLHNYATHIDDQPPPTASEMRSALDNIQRAVLYQYLRTATNISNVLAHALHFYLYLMFSAKMRHDFLAMIRRWYVVPCPQKNPACREDPFTATFL